MNIVFLNIKRNQLIHLVAATLLLLYNFALFKNFFTAYPVTFINLVYAASLGVIVFCLLEILLTLVCYRYTTKPILIIILLLSALSSYFMNSYNVVIDADMIKNALYTNSSEAFDLFSFKLLAYVLVLGVIPSVVIYKLKINPRSFRHSLRGSLRIIIISIVLIVLNLFVFSKFYSSFFREHKSIRYYTNPIIVIYSAGKFLQEKLASNIKTLTHVGLDAKIPKTDIERELVILVVGETARADRFSLNGYTKQTNPLLEKETVYSFTNFTSCGTSTAISVPCMFSHLGSSNFEEARAHRTENLLDVLRHAGVNILWRDNNSDSKHVALRVPYEDFKNPANNPACDDECRDIGMLAGLQEYINSKQGDILVVLHQMGNHGPAYYKRYPKEFEKFTPVCKTNQLEKCSAEEINNAYDNAILYTDYFLAQVIKFLKQNDPHFETSMVYISDHGESLGEKGVYLHGLPNFMAPDAQKNVGAIFWFGTNFEDLNTPALTGKKTQAFTHDNLFHTILGIFEIKSDIYDKQKDIIEYIPEHQH